MKGTIFYNDSSEESWEIDKEKEYRTAAIAVDLNKRLSKNPDKIIKVILSHNDKTFTYNNPNDLTHKDNNYILDIITTLMS